MDSRKRRGKHQFHEVLLCILLGLLAGRRTVRHSLQWCQSRLGMLRQFMPLENGIASGSTACRMLQDVCVEDLYDLFTEWACSICSPKGTFLSVDGKGIRAATEKIKGGRTPYVMNIVDVGTKLCLGITEVGEKENEKTAFHRILERIDISGSVITADAMATDQYIMSDITNRGGDFIFQVKQNNPEMQRELFCEMELLLKEIEKEKKLSSPEEKNEGYQDAIRTYSHYQSNETNGGRVEYRECHVTHDVTLLDAAKGKGYVLGTIGTIEQIRILQQRTADGTDITPDKTTLLKGMAEKKTDENEGSDEQDIIQRIGIISSLTLSAEEALHLKRSYWSIENQLHYVLDQTFLEDRDRSSKNHYRMAVLRRFAYNVTRIMQKREKAKQTLAAICYEFCDRADYVEKYVFKGIRSFY